MKRETHKSENGIRIEFYPNGTMERYWTFNGLGREMIEYEYIHTNGMRFSTTAFSLEEARKFRDVWLKEKKK